MPISLMHFAKLALRRLDVSVERWSKSPEMTMLGLRSLPMKTILDIGANEGQFARKFAVHFPAARLCCFEPLPEAFAKLAAWAEDDAGRIQVFNVALGECEGIVEMFKHKEHTVFSSLLRSTQLSEQYYPSSRIQEATKVRLLTLDKAVAEFSIQLIDPILIKLDVQGYEDRVIQGGSAVFQKADACIVEVCLDTLYESQPTFLSLATVLSELGFYYSGNLEQACAADGHVIFLDAVFRRGKVL